MVQYFIHLGALLSEIDERYDFFKSVFFLNIYIYIMKYVKVLAASLGIIDVYMERLGVRSLN